ncbi:anaphase promoting complex subunit 5 [Kluyveromyces marxianus]|nr:anaphase promoting complex subunit 5 [Kluyveromyces marxianus]KAG0685049.1 anaphase promoting complex subunit 5 [Kluyveromyces marxianus]
MTTAYQPILIVRGYDPYDISSVILVLLYCLGSKDLTPNIILGILQLTPKANSIGVGLPTLENFVKYLLKVSTKRITINLLHILFSITNYDQIQDLIHLLQEAIVTSLDQQRVSSRFDRLLCVDSAIYDLLPRIIVDSSYEHYFVEDVVQIIQSLESFKLRFTHCDIYKEFESEIFKPNSILDQIFSHPNPNDCEVSPFTTVENNGNTIPWLVVSGEKFSILLNYVVQLAISKSTSDDLSESIIEYTSFNDRTRFPDIILLEMIHYRKIKDYEKTIERIYQYFDYCRNSNIAVTSSSNFSHICQTFVLSSLHQDHGSPEVALKSLHELIETIREKSGLHGLCNLWDVLIHHIFIQPGDLSSLQRSIHDLLKPFNDNQSTSPEMLQYFFTSQLVLNLHEVGYVPKVLELLSTVIAISSGGLTDDKHRVTAEVLSLAWSFLGFDDIGSCYSELIPTNRNKQKQLQRVEKLVNNKFYTEAVSAVEKMLEETERNDEGMTWKFSFMRKKIEVMLAAGNPARAHPLIIKYTEKCRETRNDYELSYAILYMARLLNGWKQYKDSYKLLSANIHIIFQYSQSLKDQAKILYKEARNGLSMS